MGRCEDSGSRWERLLSDCRSVIAPSRYGRVCVVKVRRELVTAVKHTLPTDNTWSAPAVMIGSIRDRYDAESEASVSSLTNITLSSMISLEIRVLYWSPTYALSTRAHRALSYKENKGVYLGETKHVWNAIVTVQSSPFPIVYVGRQFWIQYKLKALRGMCVK